MNWHFVVRTGAVPPPTTPEGAKRIEFYVGADAPAGTSPDQIVARNVLTKLKFAGVNPPQEAIDLHRFAVAAYVADQRVRRNAYDGWTRPIALHVPVLNSARWKRVAPVLAEFLRFLTGDAWSIYPYEAEAARSKDQLPSEAAAAATTQAKFSTDKEPPGVCLLSGGLDSFLGAVAALSSAGQWVLVSHQARGSANHQAPAQNRLIAALGSEFGQERISPLTFDVTRLRMPPGQKAEGSMRSRSVVFLALGTLAAAGLPSRGQPASLLIPENGFVSLNVPLTRARLGSHSTRTTHPHTLSLFTKVLSELGLVVSVQNPFAFSTKGEMLYTSPAAKFAKQYATQTVSCSNAGNTYRFSGGSKTHCGSCIPCLVRRSAMKTVDLDDPGPYLVDLTRGTPKRGSLADCNLKAIGMAIARTADGASGVEVLKAGPLPGNVDKYVGVYERGLAEIEAFLG